MSSRPTTLADVPPAPQAAPSLRAAAVLQVCFWALLLIGIAFRLAPFADLDARMYWQHMTEDGYLMQTIARNMAIGRGMTTADGTIATNGVQPLATFVFAALHWLGGGDKLAGIAWVTAISAAVAAAAAWFAYQVGLRLFATLRFGRELALAAALLWFGAPLIAGHSMNGLETGIDYLAIFFTLAEYLRRTGDGRRAFGWGDRAVLGVLLGLTFLARNDTVFFIAGLLLAHVGLGGREAGGGWRHRFIDGLAAGVLSMVVALPWLINNVLLFGTIVPISGIAQYGLQLGANLVRVPAILFETAFGYAPVPNRLEGTPAVAVVTLLAVLAAIAGFWVFVARRELATRRFFVAGLFFTLCVVSYYGVFFGAAHFLSRYCSPLSAFLWFAACGAVYGAVQATLRTPARLHAALAAGVTALTVVSAAFAASRGLHPEPHMHKQVVDWVQANVKPSSWVGAVQTGTLGYFHDRTINLDGKVNPAALREVRAKGHVLDYVVDSKIDYIADWVGVTTWPASNARFGAAFEEVARDERANLGVLRRRDIPQDRR